VTKVVLAKCVDLVAKVKRVNLETMDFLDQRETAVFPASEVIPDHLEKMALWVLLVLLVHLDLLAVLDCPVFPV